VKWFLIGLAGVFCSATWVRGDAAGDLYSTGVNDLAADNYTDAVKNFDQIINGYPNTPNIDEVRIRDGFAYLHLGDFPNAIKTLAPEAAMNAKPEFRGTGLYFTGLAQFSQGQSTADKSQSKAAFGQAVGTFTSLIDHVTKNPTPDNQAFMEDAIYYRGLSYYQMEDFANAEKDLLKLLDAYPKSLKQPDYLLLLGSLYAVETNQAVAAKATPDVVKAAAQKALDRFAQVSNDPNALVQANDANMSQAEVYYLIAQLDPTGAGYQKALDAFRQVRRKADMVELQQTRLDQLKKASSAALQASAGGASMANENVRLIDRESGRLEQLKSGPDPIVQALIRIAECYNAMKPPEADEARVVLRRLSHATLTPAQQQEVDFQLLTSYVLGGQTDAADAALTDYLTKHPGDPQADSISFQIAGKLLDKKDYNGALKEADRSLSDFPKGRLTSEVHSLKASAYKNLGQLDKATDELKLAATGSGPMAIPNQLTGAATLAAQGNLTAALDMYKQVKDNPTAGDLQAFGASGYINTLQALGRCDEVIAEAKNFATKYPTSKALPGVLVFEGLAMDRKNDPGAIAVLQDVAKKYPQDDASSFALFYVVTIYQRTGNIPAMLQAAKDLNTAYPTAYTFLGQAAEIVGAENLKEKKFDDAVAVYQPLTAAPKPDVAAGADNKIGEVWLAAAKAMGYIQSLQPDARAEAEKRIGNAEQSYLTVLTKYPDQLDAVGDAFQGLYDVLKARRSGGLLTDATMEDYFAKLTAGLNTGDMAARVELAKAGLVFVYKKGVDQYPAALDRFKKAIAASPSLVLTRQEANQYGELLLAAKDYSTAIDVFTNLLSHAAPDNAPLLADCYYGLGATYLAQGNVAKAAENFSKLKSLPGGAPWFAHMTDVDYGLALAAEQAGDPNGLAKATYARLMQATGAGIQLQAKAMIGYGHLLEKAGYGVTPAVKDTIEFAVHYYQQVDLLYGPAVPELSAEGLYSAGQAYDKAGDKANAAAQYKKLIDTYGKTAPDWAAKAQAASH
jgi:tetratricopeptide (TPR) repeat protein